MLRAMPWPSDHQDGCLDLIERAHAPGVAATSREMPPQHWNHTVRRFDEVVIAYTSASGRQEKSKAQSIAVSSRNIRRFRFPATFTEPKTPTNG